MKLSRSHVKVALKLNFQNTNQPVNSTTVPLLLMNNIDLTEWREFRVSHVGSTRFNGRQSLRSVFLASQFFFNPPVFFLYLNNWLPFLRKKDN